MVTHELSFFVFPLNQRIVDKCVQNTHQGVFVVPQKLHRDLARLAECAFDARNTKCIHDIVGEAEWNPFRRFEGFTLYSNLSHEVLSVGCMGYADLLE